MAMKERFVFLLLWSFSSEVFAGTFMAGSIRWKKVDTLQVRFDIVTYWTKSFSIYNNPQPGQEALVALTAQNTVQFDPGDGSPARYLKANVTDASNEEDWFSAVSVVHHTYPRPWESSVQVPDYSQTTDGGQRFIAHNTPWMASLSGCCRYGSSGKWYQQLTNDATDKFLLTSLVDLSLPLAASPDPRNPPRIFLQDVLSNFTVPTPVPYLTPSSIPSSKVMWRWCQSSAESVQIGWSLPEFPSTTTGPARPAVAIDSETGLVTWLGGLLAAGGGGPAAAGGTAGFHLCVETCVGVCDWTDNIVDRTTSQTDFMLLVSAAPPPAAVTISTSVAPGGVAHGVAGHVLTITVTAAIVPAAAAAAAGGLRLTRGHSGPADFGPRDPAGRVVVVSPTSSSGASLVARAVYTVPAGLEGWGALCFQASLGGNEATSYVSSPLACVDILFSAVDAPEIRLVASQFQTGPTTFAMRDGQNLSAVLSASLLAQDDVASVRIEPPVPGALLVPLSAGTNVVQYAVSYSPSRSDAGSTVALCFAVTGLAVPGRPTSSGRSCIQVAVERCVWSVRQDESLLTIAQDLKMSWLQLWNFNKAWLREPDVDLKPGMPLNVGQMYEVVEGDTLTRIASTFSTSVEHLLRLNVDLQGGALLQPGTGICVAFASCTA